MLGVSHCYAPRRTANSRMCHPAYAFRYPMGTSIGSYMSSKGTDENPYRSPRGVLSQKRKRTRWRLVPVVFLYILGFWALFVSVFEVLFCVMWLTSAAPSWPVPGMSVGLQLLYTGLGIVVGPMWILAATAWWRDQRWRAGLATALGAAAYLLQSWLTVTLLR